MKNLKKPLVFGFIVALVSILFFGYFFNKKGSEKESGTQKNTEFQIHVVYLSEDGFTPQELFIHTGDIVRFSSKKGGWFWPASNPHPSHTAYPAFDPQKPLAAQESWDFKFEHAGEWRYHDHLAPYFTGTVIVGN